MKLRCVFVSQTAIFFIFRREFFLIFKIDFYLPLEMKNKIETVVMHQQGNSPHRIFIIQTKKKHFSFKNALRLFSHSNIAKRYQKVIFMKL